VTEAGGAATTGPVTTPEPNDLTACAGQYSRVQSEAAVSTPGATLDRFLTIGEAADLTRFGCATLRNAERAGKLPGYRVLGRLRFKLSDVLAWIEAGRTAPRRLPPPELLAHGGRPRGRRRG
jgi:excisionase family DNA binding protein